MNDKQKQLLQLVKEIDTFCNTHNITYYCAAGTVLGAIRHGGFIPWDDDIDLLMTRDEFRRFVDAFKRDGIPGRKIVFHEDDPNHHSTVARYIKEDSCMFCHYHILGYAPAGILIDIFVLDPVPDDREMFMEHLAKFYAYSDLVAPTLSHSNRLPNKYSCMSEKYIHEASVKGTETVAHELADSLFSLDEKESSRYMLRWGSQPFLYPKDFFGNPEYFSFEDMQIPVPSKWYLYLVSHYSFDWTDIPVSESRDQHISIFNPREDYHKVYELRDQEFNQDKLETLHRRLQASRMQSDALCHQLEPFAAELHFSICNAAINKRAEANNLSGDLNQVAHYLFDKAEYRLLLKVFESYITLQTSPMCMGGRKHGRYYHWVFPIVVPIKHETLIRVLWSLIYIGRLTECEKISGIYIRADLKTEELSEIRRVLDHISTSMGLYYSGDYESALTCIRGISGYENIPLLKNYELLSLVHINSSDPLLSCLMTDSPDSEQSPEFAKAKADLLFLKGDSVAACKAYERLMENVRNGMFLKDIKEKGFDIDLQDPYVLAEDIGSCMLRKKSLSEEILDICGRHHLKCASGDFYEPYSLLITAESASKLMEILNNELPADRALLSWNVGSSVKDFALRYCDTSTTFVNLRRLTESENKNISITIYILRSDSNTAINKKISKHVEAALNIMMSGRCQKTSSGSNIKRFIINRLAGISSETSAKWSKRAFRSFLKHEASATKSDYYFYSAGNSFAPKIINVPKSAFSDGAVSTVNTSVVASKSIYILCSTDISASELITEDVLSSHKKLPWDVFNNANNKTSRLDKSVREVWSRLILLSKEISE